MTTKQWMANGRLYAVSKTGSKYRVMIDFKDEITSIIEIGDRTYKGYTKPSRKFDLNNDLPFDKRLREDWKRSKKHGAVPPALSLRRIANALKPALRQQ